mmetsp:Transcript_18375/g.42458  ORF Transcript_18375/g.42458 Transcript_18375/m.42458 type:complete len:213 (+) Transcript_18375:5769-6407(+)
MLQTLQCKVAHSSPTAPVLFRDGPLAVQSSALPRWTKITPGRRSRGKQFLNCPAVPRQMPVPILTSHPVPKSVLLDELRIRQILILVSGPLLLHRCVSNVFPDKNLTRLIHCVCHIGAPAGTPLCLVETPHVVVLVAQKVSPQMCQEWRIRRQSVHDVTPNVFEAPFQLKFVISGPPQDEGHVEGILNNIAHLLNRQQRPRHSDYTRYHPPA